MQPRTGRDAVLTLALFALLATVPAPAQARAGHGAPKDPAAVEAKARAKAAKRAKADERAAPGTDETKAEEVAGEAEDAAEMAASDAAPPAGASEAKATEESANDLAEVLAPFPPNRPFIKGPFADLGLGVPRAADRTRRGRARAARRAEPVVASIQDADPEAAATPRFLRAGGDFMGLIDDHATAQGVPLSLAHAVVKVESRYNPRAAHAGNYGLMQIRLATARSMGYVGDAQGLLDPETNLRFGMKYLAAAHKLAGGSLCGTAAKYQGGLRAPVGSRSGRVYCAKVRANGAGG